MFSVYIHKARNILVDGSKAERAYENDDNDLSSEAVFFFHSIATFKTGYEDKQSHLYFENKAKMTPESFFHFA